MLENYAIKIKRIISAMKLKRFLLSISIAMSEEIALIDEYGISEIVLMLLLTTFAIAILPMLWSKK